MDSRGLEADTATSRGGSAALRAARGPRSLLDAGHMVPQRERRVLVSDTLSIAARFLDRAQRSVGALRGGEQAEKMRWR